MECERCGGELRTENVGGIRFEMCQACGYVPETAKTLGALRDNPDTAKLAETVTHVGKSHGLL